MTQLDGPSDQPFDREVRLGLVLYGGVSLAVYMSGVAQEMFDAVRGRGVYALAKALIASDVTVDIISGASAGGINGVLLAHALANGLEFEACAQLWRDVGDIELLMRPVTSKSPPSLLMSESFFQTQLEGALEKLGRQPVPLEPHASTVDTLDLFVTATDYHGQLSQRRDELGSPIDVKEHRRVFRLKHRSWGSDLRIPTAQREVHQRALATVCRATATFPAAFAPVVVPGIEPAVHGARAARGGDREPQHFLHTWAASRGGEGMVLVDGGVLDNKPFTHTLREIYLHTASREVDRKMIYVEPDPEQFAAKKPGEAPNVLGVVMGALLSLPGYESIASDLRELDERNARVRDYQALESRVRAAVREKRLPLLPSRSASDESKQLVTGQAVHPVLAADLARQLSVEAQVRAHRDAVLSSFFESRSLPVERQDELRTTSEVFISVRPDEKERDWFESKLAYLKRCDVDFRLRRLFHLSYYVYDVLYPTPPSSERASATPAVIAALPPTEDPTRRVLRNLLHALNRHIQVLKVVRCAEESMRAQSAERLATRLEQQGGEVLASDWEQVVRDHETFFAFDPAARPWMTALEALPAPDDAVAWLEWAPDDSTMSGLSTDLMGHAARAALPDPGPSLLLRLDGAVKTLIDRFQEHPAAEAIDIQAIHDAFPTVDAILFPVEYTSGLREKDPIDLVRISPRDAQIGLCRRPVGEKISGDALAHFSTFLKASWRSNDILWGRLDGTTQLLMTLLQPRRIARLVAEPGRRKRVRDALLALARPRPGVQVAPTDPARPMQAVLVATLGARALSTQTEDADGTGVRAFDLAQWLDDATGEDEGPRADATTDVMLGYAARALCHAAQMQRVEQVLPTVVAASAAQSQAWGTIPGGGRASEGDGSIDPLVAAIAAQEAARLVATHQAPPPLDDPVRFFVEQYKVGAETVTTGIPPLVLLRMGSHAALVLHAMLVTALAPFLPRPLEAILKPAGWVFRGLAVLVHVFARTGESRALTQARRGLSILLLAVGIARPDLWQAEGGHDIDAWFLLFIAAPVLFLVLDAVFVYPRKTRWLARLATAAGVLVGIVAYVRGAYEAVPGALHALTTSVAALPSLALVPVALVAGGWILAQLTTKKEER